VRRLRPRTMARPIPVCTHARAAALLPLLVLLLAPLARAGTLVLASEPSGARAFVGGEPVGVTPCGVPLPDTLIGAVQVRFELEGYVPVTVDIGVAPQREYALKANLVRPGEVGGGPAGGGGTVTVEPGSRGAAVARTIDEALKRFQQDCMAFPAALADLTAASGDQLSSRVNGAGERIAGGNYRGPYLDAIPPDPATGLADWDYDCVAGSVASRLTAAPVARLEGRPRATAAPVALEDWLACFQRATGVRYVPAAGGPVPAGPGGASAGPAGGEWRILP
jgi:hypothetical protein